MNVFGQSHQAARSSNPTNANEHEGVPSSGGTHELTWSHFLSLVEHVSKIRPRAVSSKISTSNPKSQAEKVTSTFQRWVESLQKPLHPHTSMILFRLLFPQEDKRRRYNLKETRLAGLIFSIYGGERSGGQRWKPDANSGCLGQSVRRMVMDGTAMNAPGKEISLEKIDQLLDELARHSAFSNLGPSVSTASLRPQRDILHDLFETLTPFGAAVMTQVILQDLRPILYPMPASQSTHLSLLEFKSNSLHELSLWEAMRIWDARMPGIFRIRANIDEALEALGKLDAGERVSSSPHLGSLIEIPKCLKGERCHKVIEVLRGGGASGVWAETKYDGERMQIHVDVSKSGGPSIRIFSKSKRDSTLDRVATHPIILAALGFPSSTADKLLDSRLGALPPAQHTIKQGVILEGEMVCYNEVDARIDEFWHIRRLVEQTAVGGRGVFRAQSSNNLVPAPTKYETHPDDSKPKDPKRHLMIVFFDILFLDGESLLRQPYEYRRNVLEANIRAIDGYSMCAERALIDLTRGTALKSLRAVYAKTLACYEEGLVLKPSSSTYNDYRPGMKWIKLKKDYIPGLGDTLDLAVVGASWDKERGRELRVGPETLTTFFVGAIDNEEPRSSKGGRVPHIEVLFSVSYGLDREQLEDFNWRIKNSVTYPYRNENDLVSSRLAYTMSFPSSMPTSSRPSTIFQQPQLAEIVGGGFTRSPGSLHYELRFPRLIKVWRAEERNWKEGVDLKAFQQAAYAAVGIDPPSKRTLNLVRDIWDLPPTSPSARSAEKIQKREAIFEKQLRDADGSSVDMRKQSPKRSKPLGQRPIIPEQQENRTLRALGSLTNLTNATATLSLVQTDTRQARPTSPCLVSSSTSTASAHSKPDCNMLSPQPSKNPQPTSKVKTSSQREKQNVYHNAAADIQNLPVKRHRDAQSLSSPVTPKRRRIYNVPQCRTDHPSTRSNSTKSTPKLLAAAGVGTAHTPIVQLGGGVHCLTDLKGTRERPSHDALQVEPGRSQEPLCGNNRIPPSLPSRHGLGPPAQVGSGLLQNQAFIEAKEQKMLWNWEKAAIYIYPSRVRPNLSTKSITNACVRLSAQISQRRVNSWEALLLAIRWKPVISTESSLAVVYPLSDVEVGLVFVAPTEADQVTTAISQCYKQVNEQDSSERPWGPCPLYIFPLNHLTYSYFFEADAVTAKPEPIWSSDMQ